MSTHAALELVDIGVNLTHEAFAHDREEVVGRARAAGVTTLIITGTSIASSEHAVMTARGRAPALYATAGVHPHDAKTLTDAALARLAALAQDDSVRALGECGLDYYRNFSPRDAQLRAFEAQLDLATCLKLPLFLHEREAHADLYALLRRYRDGLAAGVVHCFTGTQSELHAYLDLDLHIGITGWICDERRGLALHPLIPEIPPHRLMLETDAPYLLPRTLRPAPASRRNEPAFLIHVLSAVAALTGRTAMEVAEDTTQTARAFFRI